MSEDIYQLGEIICFRSRSSSRSRSSCSSTSSSRNSYSSNVTVSDARMFNHPLYSDIKIFIGNVILCAHRVFICSRSAYCQKTFCDSKVHILFGDKESSPLDKKYAAAYWRAFEFLYKGTYENKLSTKGIRDDSDLLRDVRVYRTAELFELDELKHLAKTRLKEKLSGDMVNLDQLTECVREIYATPTDPKLRHVVVKAIVRKGPDLCHDLLLQGGEFVIDCLRYYQRDKCRNCGFPKVPL